MKRLPKTELLSILSIVLGIAGMAMHSWHLSEMDNHGLLPVSHLGDRLTYVLFAILIAVCFFVLRNIRTSSSRRYMFPRSTLAAIGTFLAAAGIAYSLTGPQAVGSLARFVPMLGVLSVLALAYAGYCRLKGKRPHFLMYGLVVLFLIFRTLANCQQWSAETQVAVYFFPLMAHLFLLLSVYFRAALEAHIKNCRHYMLFRQLTIFCCLVSMAEGNGAFYLAAVLWLTTDFCVPAYYGKYIV